MGKLLQEQYTEAAAVMSSIHERDSDNFAKIEESLKLLITLHQRGVADQLASDTFVKEIIQAK